MAEEKFPDIKSLSIPITSNFCNDLKPNDAVKGMHEQIQR